MKLKEVRQIYRVRYGGILSHETVLIIANDLQQAISKAETYRKNYTVISDWAITNVELLSETLI